MLTASEFVNLMRDLFNTDIVVAESCARSKGSSIISSKVARVKNLTGRSNKTSYGTGTTSGRAGKLSICGSVLSVGEPNRFI